MGKGRDAARSDTRTAKPASETTTHPPGEKRRRSRGTLHRNKLLENRKRNFQESSQQANPARKTPPGIAQVNDNTRQAAEADPTQNGGETATGREEKGPSPTSSSVRVPQNRTRQKRGQQCGTYIATEPNGLPKEGTKPLRGKAGPHVRAQL